MNDFVLSLVALAIAATLQPPQVISLLVLLQTQRSTANGFVYIAGMSSFRLALGLTFWVFVSNVETTVESSGSKFSVLVGTVLIVLGLIMFVYALRKALTTQDDNHTAVSWLEKLDSISFVQVFLMGVGFLALDPKDWLIDISAVNLIADADLSNLASLLTYLVYILMAQSLLLFIFILTITVPQQAQRRFAALAGWMKNHERSFEIILAILFGLVFLTIGLELVGGFSSK